MSTLTLPPPDGLFLFDGLTLAMLTYLALILAVFALCLSDVPLYDCADCPATYTDHRELMAHERSYHP